MPACTRALVTISLTATWAASMESSITTPVEGVAQESPRFAGAGRLRRQHQVDRHLGFHAAHRALSAGVCEARHANSNTGSNRWSIIEGWPPTSLRPAGHPRCGLPTRPTGRRTAVAWLLDLCPPDYRRYTGLRRHVVVLARFAVLHVEANQAAVRRGLSEVRADLRDVASLEVVDAAVQTFQLEEARLLGVRRAVGLVEEALRGRRYVARL